VKLSDKEITIIGASLYLCEGTRLRIDNRGYKQFAVEFTNRDPRTILLFLRFLRNFVNINEERLKAELFIYPDHNESQLINFWSQLTKIPINRFNKVIKLQQKNQKFKPNPLGVLKLRYHNKDHFLKISHLIEDVFGIEEGFAL
jgi:hypothetical protein